MNLESRSILLAAIFFLSSTAWAGDLEVQGRLGSTAPSGPPLAVSSAERVADLDVDRVDGVDAAALARKLGNVVTLSTTGGDFAQLDLAFQGIEDSSSANPYVIRLGPGAFPCVATCTPPPHVAIVGSGRGATRILASRGPLRFEAPGSLRHLTVEGWRGGAVTVGSGGRLDAYDVELINPGDPSGSVVASGIRSSGDLRLENARIAVAGSAVDAQGVGLYGPSDLRNVEVRVAGGSDRNVGISAVGAVVRAAFLDVSVTAGTAKGRGVEVEELTTTTDVVVTDSRLAVLGDGAGGDETAVIVSGGTVRLERIEASAPLALLTYSASGSAPTEAVTFRHSRLDGPIRPGANGTDAGTRVILDHVRVVTPGESPVASSSDGTIHVLHSTLEGQAVSNTGSGSVVCRFTTDENLATYTSACP